MASRSGVRDTCSDRAQLAFIELGAGRDAAFDDALAQPRGHFLVQHLARNGDDVSHAGLPYSHTKMNALMAR